MHWFGFSRCRHVSIIVHFRQRKYTCLESPTCCFSQKLTQALCVMGDCCVRMCMHVLIRQMNLNLVDSLYSIKVYSCPLGWKMNVSFMITFPEIMETCVCKVNESAIDFSQLTFTNTQLINTVQTNHVTSERQKDADRDQQSIFLWHESSIWLKVGAIALTQLYHRTIWLSGWYFMR